MLEKVDLKIDGQIDKNIAYIKQYFPSVITETQDENGKIVEKIDFEKLKQELSDQIIEGKEAYNFTWPGKKKAILEANTPTNKTLRPYREESVNFDTTENLYIEGDNLEVLKLLQNTYFKKVKMIYIDPPYNTGTDSFIYNDKFTMDSEEYEEATGFRDEDGDIQFKQNKTSNPRYHSDWCTMMYSRLKLARNLLTDDGVIFISIDDNEQANLKKICDEVFGRSDIPVFTRITKKSSNNGNNFAPCTDYVLTYSKNALYLKEFKTELDNDTVESYNKVDSFVDTRGKYKEIGLFQSALKHGGSSYYIKCPDGEEVIPPDGKPWRWNKTTFENGLNEDRIVFKITKNSPLLNKNGEKSKWNIYTKTYLKEREINGVHPKNFSDEFQNTLATNELNKLSIPFEFPKPTALIKFLIKLSTSDNDIILDFFSGSATTAHAVMQLNAEDGGKRKFILVNLPEECKKDSEAYKQGFKNICEIGKERIRRAGKKIKEEFLSKKDITEEEKQRIENLDIGFRVLKLDSNNMIDTSFTPGKTTQDLLSRLQENIKQDRNSEDLLYACFIKFALELNIPYEIKDVNGFKIYVVNENELVACFDKNITMKVVEAMADLKPMRVVFRDNSFATSADRINAEQIFKYRSPETDEKDIVVI